MSDNNEDRDLKALGKAVQAVWLMHCGIKFDGVAIEGDLPFGTPPTRQRGLNSKNLCVSYLAGVLAAKRSEPIEVLREELLRVVGVACEDDEVTDYLRQAKVVKAYTNVNVIAGEIEEELFRDPPDGRLTYHKVREIYDETLPKCGPVIEPPEDQFRETE